MCVGCVQVASKWSLQSSFHRYESYLSIQGQRLFQLYPDYLFIWLVSRFSFLLSFFFPVFLFGIFVSIVHIVIPVGQFFFYSDGETSTSVLFFFFFLLKGRRPIFIQQKKYMSILFVIDRRRGKGGGQCQSFQLWMYFIRRSSSCSCIAFAVTAHSRHTMSLQAGSLVICPFCDVSLFALPLPPPSPQLVWLLNYS